MVFFSWLYPIMHIMAAPYPLIASLTMRFGSTAKVLLKYNLKYYRISECPCCLLVHASEARAFSGCHTMRFGSTAKVLAECKLKYCRISECVTVTWSRDH